MIRFTIARRRHSLGGCAYIAAMLVAIKTSLYTQSAGSERLVVWSGFYLESYQNKMILDTKFLHRMSGLFLSTHTKGLCSESGCTWQPCIPLKSPFCDLRCGFWAIICLISDSYQIECFPCEIRYAFPPLRDGLPLLLEALDQQRG